MKLWILLAIAILLIVWGSREGFETPASTCPSGFRSDGEMGGFIQCAKEMGEPVCPAGETKTPVEDLGDGSYSGGTCEKDGVLTDMAKCPEGSSPRLNPQGKLICMKYEYISKPQQSGGTTTGGSSSTSTGPNSGGMTSRSKQVFGPTFTGRGEGDGVVPSDSSKTNEYPELIGGGNAKPSTRVEGAGITNPSRNFEGSLPTTAGLGADENSKYLPFSRQPGDMELIPDPYRVSQQFSAANYSLKTEPVPFLTDFSAFQR